jgi:hypothetical protein
MAGDPRIRASDDDRERAVSLLREHHAAGRLTLDEFSERLDKAYTAKTLGELDEIMSDLPAIDLYRLPDAQLSPYYRSLIPGSGGHLQAARAGGGVVSPHGRFSPAWAAAWGSWLSVTVICFVIWAVSGSGYLWPLWIVGPWGAIMLGRWVSGSHPGGGPHGHGPHHHGPQGHGPQGHGPQGHGPHQGRQIRAERPDQIGGETNDR